MSGPLRDDTAVDRWLIDHAPAQEIEDASRAELGEKNVSMIIQPSKPNWLVKLLGWEAKLIVITDPKDNAKKKLDYRPLEWGEWFSALRGKLEGVTLPAIAEFCRGKPGEAKLQELYKHYIKQGMEKIDKNDAGAQKVERAALVLQNANVAPEQWQALSSAHTKASIQMYQKLIEGGAVSNQKKLAYLTLPILNSIGLATFMEGLQGKIEKSDMQALAVRDPATALKLLTSPLINDIKAKDVFSSNDLYKLSSSGYRLDKVEVELVRDEFNNFDADQKAAALKLRSTDGGKPLLWSPAHLSQLFEEHEKLISGTPLPGTIDQPKWNNLYSKYEQAETIDNVAVRNRVKAKIAIHLVRSSLPNLDRERLVVSLPLFLDEMQKTAESREQFKTEIEVVESLIKELENEQVLGSDLQIAKMMENPARFLPESARPGSLDQSRYDALYAAYNRAGTGENPVQRNRLQVGIAKHLIMSARPDVQKKFTLQDAESLKARLEQDIREHGDLHKGLDALLMAKVDTLIKFLTSQQG